MLAQSYVAIYTYMLEFKVKRKFYRAFVLFKENLTNPMMWNATLKIHIVFASYMFAAEVVRITSEIDTIPAFKQIVSNCIAGL